MDIVYLFNGFETALWLFMAAYVAWLSTQVPQRRRSLLLAAMTFVAFAGSEIVEMQTGAWWRPLWLMIWKGVCITTLVVIGIAHWNWHRAHREDVLARSDTTESAGDSPLNAEAER